jgi:basic amino acid/polyamine antiporter, APA family
MSSPLSATPASVQPRPALSLLDSTSIIVGIIIGSAIYRIAPTVASSAGGWAIGAAQSYFSPPDGPPLSEGFLSAVSFAAIVGVWVLGGLVALIGAMCYAELATAYPQSGGTYVYLSESLGRSVGFAFAWAEFWIVRPGNIGAVAFVLALYGEQLLPAQFRALPYGSAGVASVAILVLAALNAAGLRAGKWTQNILTACKVAGLAGIVLTAATVSPPASAVPLPAAGSLSLALIIIMFAYGGWADMSFVAAEVRDPERNISRALLLGTGAVAAIYVAINLAFLYALGIGGLANSQAAAADVLALRFGSYGSRAISLLVVVSCLGAINGMLLTGARVFYALGTNHPVFRWLGAWNERSGVPLRSLVMQTLITLALVIGFGRSRDGFERLVVFTAPFYWGFIALVGVSLIALRLRPGSAAPTYRAPFFPLTPLLFAITSWEMARSAALYAFERRSPEAWWAVIVVVIGAIVGLIDWQARRR